MSTRNITKAYRLATASDHAEGEGWYARAREFAATLDTDVSRAVGVIAAISPMMPWDRNQTLAREIYMGKRSGCLSANMAKAVRILDGEAPLSVLSGEKVRAFYLNIMGIDSDEAVTIDRHAIMVAEGKRIDGKSLKFGKATHKRYAQEYRNAARILSREFDKPLTPAQVQATVWVWWRRGHAFHYRSEAV